MFWSDAQHKKVPVGIARMFQLDINPPPETTDKAHPKDRQYLQGLFQLTPPGCPELMGRHPQRCPLHPCRGKDGALSNEVLEKD